MALACLMAAEASEGEEEREEEMRSKAGEEGKASVKEKGLVRCGGGKGRGRVGGAYRLQGTLLWCGRRVGMCCDWGI